MMLLWAGLVYRDIRMDDGGHEEYGTPELVVRGIDLEREVSGDVWVLHSERAERFETLNRLESVRVTLTTENGAVWVMEAPEGTVTDDARDIELSDPSGRLEDDAGPVFWEAPRARWDGRREVWVFPEGIHLWNEDVDVKGTAGTLRRGGTVRLEEGAAASWKRPKN